MNKVTLLSERRNFIIVVLFSLILQLIFLSANPMRRPTADAYGYDQIGLNIAKGKGFSMDGISPTSLYPLYPALLGLIYYFFGQNYIVVQLILSLFVALSCGIYCSIGRFIFEEKRALLAGIIMSIHPAFISLSRIMYAEPLFIFLLSSFIFLFIRALQIGKVIQFVFSGVVLGLAILTKPYIMLFPLIATIVIILFFKYRRGIILSVIFNFALILCILPWAARNYFLFGDFRPVSGIAIDGYRIRKVDYLAGYNRTTSQLLLNKQQQVMIEDYYARAGLKRQMFETDSSLKKARYPSIDYSGTPKNIFYLLRMMFISSYSDILDIGIPMNIFFRDPRLLKYYWHLFLIKSFTLSLSFIIFIFGFLGMFWSRKKGNLSVAILISVFIYYVFFFYFWVIFFGQVGICGRYGMPVLGILILFAVKQAFSIKGISLARKREGIILI